MPALIDKYKNILENDGVIITETDTVPAIICNALSENAVKKIYTIKQREAKKPLAIFCSDIKMARSYLHFDKINQAVIKHYCPGPITLIFEKKAGAGLAPSLNLNNNTIGLRIPNHKFLLELLKKTKQPLAATSANISNVTLNPTNIKQTFDGLVEFIGLDETKEIYMASSVFAIKGTKIELLRSGPISKQSIEDFIKNKCSKELVTKY